LGKVRTLPDESKLEISQLVEYFRALDPQSRSLISAAVKPTFSFVFLWYAKEMSVQAVRQRDHRLIFEGLASLAIQNGAFDPPESIIVIACFSIARSSLALTPQGYFSKQRPWRKTRNSLDLSRTFPRDPRRREPSASSISPKPKLMKDSPMSGVVRCSWHDDRFQ
jgi:hypothetical protein